MSKNADTYSRLLSAQEASGGGFVVLVDPDRTPPESLAALADLCEQGGVDAFFVGSSILFRNDMDAYVRRLKASTSLPVIGFPGSIGQLVPSLDAVLYLSIVSGRNPEYLFGQHVHAAPLIRSLGLEPIATGYMLVESGATTTAQYMSNSSPLPRSKPDVAAATAMAAEMMGMKLLFADGGSGADTTVPEPMIAAIAQSVSVPLVVGGGIRNPNDASRKVQAGASFVVVGNAIEERMDRRFVEELAAAVHVAVPRAL